MVAKHKCPECEAAGRRVVFGLARNLGAHRRGKHGIVSPTYAYRRPGRNHHTAVSPKIDSLLADRLLRALASRVTPAVFRAALREAINGG